MAVSPRDCEHFTRKSPLRLFDIGISEKNPMSYCCGFQVDARAVQGSPSNIGMEVLGNFGQ